LRRTRRDTYTNWNRGGVPTIYWSAKGKETGGKNRGKKIGNLEKKRRFRVLLASMVVPKVYIMPFRWGSGGGGDDEKKKEILR